MTTSVECVDALKVPLSTVLVRTGLKGIISVPETNTVEQALALLKERNIKSLPVRDGNEKITGIVNIMDLLTYAVFGVLTSDESYASHADLSRLSNAVGTIVGVTNEGKSAWSFKPYRATSELWECLYPFCAGVHRVVVLDEASGDEHLLSQTDVVRYLLAQNVALDAVLSRSLDSLDMVCGPEKVHSIAYHASALRCYRRMVMEDFSSMAVVDESGKLVANLSASDLRGLNRTNFSKLDTQVLKYLEENGGQVRAPVACSKLSTLREVMQTMLIEGVHRVWIVNDAGVPVGQVSMSDVIRVLAPVDWREPGQ